MVHVTREIISVTDSDGRFYVEKLEDFIQDSGERAPPLEGITEIIYQPGVRHALIRDHDVIGGGPAAWEPGDKLLKRAKELLSSQTSRRTATEAAAKAKVEAEIAENIAAAEARMRANTEAQEAQAAELRANFKPPTT